MEGSCGCLLCRLPAVADCARITAWAHENVGELDLAGDGYENDAHVTVLYGFTPDVRPEEVNEVVLRHAPEGVDLRLGAVGFFTNDPDYDVLKVSVESGGLQALHYSLCAAFSGRVQSDYPDYHPHLTLAYVKKGCCRHLEGNASLSGWAFRCSEFTFSTPGMALNYKLPMAPAEPPPVSVPSAAPEQPPPPPVPPPAQPAVSAEPAAAPVAPVVAAMAESRDDDPAAWRLSEFDYNVDLARYRDKPAPAKGSRGEPSKEGLAWLRAEQEKASAAQEKARKEREEREKREKEAAVAEGMRPLYSINRAVIAVVRALAGKGDYSPTTIRCYINDLLDAKEREGFNVDFGYDQRKAVARARLLLQAHRIASGPANESRRVIDEIMEQPEAPGQAGKLKVFVATKRGQGQRKSDFFWCKEGELLIFGTECDTDANDPNPDGGCGCGRSLVGIETLKGTTTFTVEERDMTPEQFEEAYVEGQRAGGWPVHDKQYAAAVRSDAKEVLRVAKTFPVGVVLEKRKDVIQVRREPARKARGAVEGLLGETWGVPDEAEVEPDADPAQEQQVEDYEEMRRDLESGDCYAITDRVRGGYDLAGPTHRSAEWGRYAAPGRRVAHFDDFDDAVRAMVHLANTSQYWPNAYSINDHGNVTQLVVNWDEGTYEFGHAWV
jgi:hypothetical protein